MAYHLVLMIVFGCQTVQYAVYDAYDLLYWHAYMFQGQIGFILKNFIMETFPSG